MTIEFIIAGLLIVNQFFTEPSKDMDFPHSFAREQIIQSANGSCKRLVDNPRLKELDPRSLIKQFAMVEGDIFGDADLSPSIKRVFKDFDFNQFFKFLYHNCDSYEQAQNSLVEFDIDKVNEEYRKILSSVGDTKSFRYGELPGIKPVFDRDGQQVGESFGKEARREWVYLNDVPPSLIEVILAAEDQSFFSHRGIDENGLLRAFMKSFSGERLEGGSTITQQVAKNLLVGSDQNLQRKFVEMATAFYLERDLGKERILELYLNLVYMGQNAWGFKLAAKTYFNKELKDLTLSEQATLAGLIKWPGRHNPLVSPQVAKTRRDQVLEALLSIKSKESGPLNVTPEMIDQAKNEPINAIRTPSNFGDDDLQYFLTSASTEMASPLFRFKDYYELTMNTKLQKIVTQALREGLEEYERKWGRNGYRGPVANLLDLAKESEDSKEDEKKSSLSFLRKRTENKTTAVTEETADEDTDKKDTATEETANEDSVTQGTDKSVSERLNNWTDMLKSFRPPVESLNWLVAAVLTPELELGFQNGSRGRLKDPKAWSQKIKLGDVVYVKKIDEELFQVVQLPEVEGSVVVMNPQNGEVLALSGGYIWNSQNQFNRATMALRQPGSLVKPFTYMAALQDGQQPNELILDSPIKLVNGKRWPKNYDRTLTNNYLTMRYGLEHSVNTMTVRLMTSLGLPSVLDIMRDFGLYEKPLQEYSIVLGSQVTTLINITKAYAQIANGGKRITPSFLRHNESKGRLRDLESVDKTTLMQIRNLLQGVVQRGTAVRIRKYGQFVAGKTGTSNESRDVWFVGFTPDLVIGVYVGYDKPKSLSVRGVPATGSSVALPIFTNILEETLKLEPRNLSEYRFQEFSGANVEYRPIPIMNRHESLKNSEVNIDEMFRRGYYSPNQVLTENREALNIRNVDSEMDSEDSNIPTFPEILIESELSAPTPSPTPRAAPVPVPGRVTPSPAPRAAPNPRRVTPAPVPRTSPAPRAETREARESSGRVSDSQPAAEEKPSSDGLWDWVIELQNEQKKSKNN